MHDILHLEIFKLIFKGKIRPIILFFLKLSHFHQFLTYNKLTNKWVAKRKLDDLKLTMLWIWPIVIFYREFSLKSFISLYNCQKSLIESSKTSFATKLFSYFLVIYLSLVKVMSWFTKWIWFSRTLDIYSIKPVWNSAFIVIPYLGKSNLYFLLVYLIRWKWMSTKNHSCL